MNQYSDSPSLRIPQWLPLLLFSAFLLYFLPAPWQEIRIHDTFDGNFTTREVLIQSGHLFDLNPSAVVPGIMNGLPRGVFPRNSEITSILMWCFGSLNGYALTFILVRIFAIIGFYRLGKDHLNVPNNQKGLLLMVSVLFACLPFFIIHGLTVAGLPFLFWAFLNVYKGVKQKLSYLIFTLFVLWSNFILVGVHLLVCLGIWVIYLTLKNRKVNINLVFSCIYIAMLYVASDYMLFYTHYFNSAYESSRNAMEKTLGLNINGVLGSTLIMFFTGHYSTAGYAGFLFFPFMVLAVYYKLSNRISNQWFNLAIVCFLVCFLMTLCVNILDWKAMAVFYKRIPIAKVFNLQRFTSILPSVFFISLLLTILFSFKTFGNKIQFTMILCLLLFFGFIWRGNISFARNAFNTTGVRIFNNQQVRYSDFFDKELYRKIKLYLKNYKGNVIHFGLSSSPSKHFGLNVLDDYQGDYPKAYKAEFRLVIKRELEKSSALLAYFDNWGSRCYLESANSFGNTLQNRNGIAFESNLQLNTAQLKHMNCSYILSAIIIGNASENGLSLDKVITSTDNKKNIMIYKIN